MLPVNKNLTIYRGDSFDFDFRLREKNPDGTPGDYLDLTGATPKAQVRTSNDETSVAAEFTCSLGPEAGQVHLELSPEQTATLGNGVWDVQIQFADGKIRTYLTGSVATVKEVTRA